MKPALTATVIVPTSIDRGPLLPYSVGSVLRQTVADLEVFIIGDGAHDVTRDAARDLERSDPRVRFFDHPKGPRRGEIYRHQALQEARGRIVCYLCDRDLYFPDHVEEMARLLESADFAHSFIFAVGEHGLFTRSIVDLSHSDDRRAAAAIRLSIPLSFGAHTLEAYRSLSEGWATTPGGYYTDVYFFGRFAREPAMRLISGRLPTVLTFGRGGHPGWSTRRRLPELADWATRLQRPDEPAKLREEAMVAAHRDRAERARLLRHSILFRGEPLSWDIFFRVFSVVPASIRSYFLTRPDHPLSKSLRRGWRRLKYRGRDPNE